MERIPKDNFDGICKNCGQTFTGPSHKKYCCSECTFFYNNNRTETVKILKLTDRIIRKNRRILKSCYSGSDQPLHVAHLNSLGFSLGFMTEQNWRGEFMINWCYEFGYSDVSPDQVILFKRTEGYLEKLING